MVSHCNPRKTRVREGSKRREENQDINPVFHSDSPIAPLISKNQLPTPIAHRKLECASDVRINADAL